MHLGIDFGTSYTKLGYINKGRFINLAGPDAQIPSLAVYLPNQGKLYFGKIARRLNEPGAAPARFFKLELKRNPDFRLGEFTLTDIIKEYFMFLRDEYIEPGGEKIDSVTVSVPNYFGLRARSILLQAVSTAFAVPEVYLLPEPVAALLGYNYEQPVRYLDGEILCIDIGGGTTDFSFVSLSRRRNEIVMESQFQIGHDAFSGSELDRGVLRLILNPLFKMQHSREIPAPIISEKNLPGGERYWYNRLMAIAEEVKIRMSRQDTAYFNIPGFYREDSLVFSLSAEIFMAQLDSIFSRLQHYIIHQVRERAEYLGLFREGRFSLDYLLLLGGASQTRGIEQLIADLCPGPEIISPPDLSFNVVRGLCLWKQEEAPAIINVKSIYPFNFYIEKWDETKTGTVLQKIPFDTDNLELDIGSRYKIFTVPLDSPYNLAHQPGRLKLRVYELAQGDPGASLQHFMGQDLVLQLDCPAINSDMVDLYLNLGNSSIELGEGHTVSPIPGVNPGADFFARQETMLEYLSLYPGTNPELRRDYAEYLQQSSGQDYSMLLMFKLLAFLQLL
jgi:molecular chaperone DnaK (HSP70)